MLLINNFATFILASLVFVSGSYCWIVPGNLYQGAAEDISPPLAKEVCVLPIIQKNVD
jgi:hypothetical protein